jgi:ATP-dependent RNA helicase DHX37/DHR1
MSMATRVGQELALPPSRVSYQIRYDATTSSTTSIKFMTDGVLLRELANDFLLNGYSVVIVDEAHERSVNTDVLIGTLTRVVKLREELWREGKEGAKPLRMIIMSATLRVTDFTENKTLFKIPPPVVNVGARQHPVTVHFNRKTRPDYMQEAYVKVSKIHARLPPGGILVFLTGQNEIETLCKRLEQRFGQKATKERVNKRARIAQGSKAWQRGKAEETPQADGEASISTANARELDVEPEDVDLSVHTEALAADVDDGIAEEDLEALDSDAEYEDDPEEMLEYREEDSDSTYELVLGTLDNHD